MPKTFRRTGQVYQRHPINGAGDGVISNPLPKESGLVCSVFDGGTTGVTEADRNKVYRAGHFTPQADYQGRYVRLHNTPPAGGTTANDRTGFRLEDQIWRIIEVDAGGNFIRLEGVRFEDNSTTIQIDILAAADFTSASASFPAEPHTENDAGPVVHQAISFPNPTSSVLRMIPFIVGQRTSATVVRINDLFGLLSAIPTESNLEWILKDRPAYSMRDLFYTFARFLIDAGWTVLQNRGRWSAGQTTGVQNLTMDDMVFFSDGELGNRKQYLRMVFFHQNNNNNGTDGQGNVGFSWAMFSKWDETVVPTGSNVDRGEGVGINPVSLNPNVSTATNFFAGWDFPPSSNNQEPLWNVNSPQASIMPVSGLEEHRESWWTKNVAYSGFVSHPLKFPMGGSFVELNYVLFGDKDEVHFYVDNTPVGASHVAFGELEALPTQIQTNFVTQARVSAGANVVLRIGAQNPESLPSGPSYQPGDNVQIVGQTVNAGHDWQGQSHAGEFIESALIQSIGTVGAYGRINCVAQANLVDNTDTFTIDDGEGNVVTFYYDTDGGGGGVGTAIDVSGDTTAADVASTTQTVLAASALNMTFTVNGDGVDIVHNTLNSAGTNVAITENVADAGFTVEGMSGSGYGITVDSLSNEYQIGALVGEDPQPNFIASPLQFTNAFDGAQLNTIRMGNRARHGDVTYYDHNGQTDGQTNGLGFAAHLQQVPVAGYNEVDPSQRTNRFSLLGFFVRDIGGFQWRGRLRYFHMLSKRVKPFRFIQDRDGNYYLTVPPQSRVGTSLLDAESATFAIGPMPATLVKPS